MMVLLNRLLALAARLMLKRDWMILSQDLRFAYKHNYSPMKPYIPPTLITALLVAEDHRYYRHRGLDLIALLRVFLHGIRRREWHGASTIEQQLVRTVTCRYERSVRRKLREILLASLVETAIPKSEIPGLYLCIAYFGWQMNGLWQACDRLGIDLPGMTGRQSCAIVARLKYPEPKTAPTHRAQQIHLRTEYILRMLSSRAAAIDAAKLELCRDAAVLTF
jgi:membrane peptidoglycan carboxypeptidase